jgi:hypothetical protein
LGHVGLTGLEARARVADVVEFAELEEYIDQPVKTYSSGMAMRLMFSASTVIAPSLLVIDEVLGVGDAYFAKKSFDRIREICSRDGTTLLLVTHDIYNAARLCDRMLWMDHGRIVIDDRPDVVIVAYEDSVRRQEERRLRLKAMSAGGAANAAPARLLVEIRSADGRPLPAPLYLGRLALCLDGTPIDLAPLVAGADSVGTRGQLVFEGGAWGEEEVHEGRRVRPFRNFGSVFHKVAVLFDVTGVTNTGALSIVFEGWSAAECAIDVVAFNGDDEKTFGRFAIPANRWTVIDTRRDALTIGSLATMSHAKAIGSGAVVLTGIRACDSHDRTSFIFEHGSAFTLRIRYQVHDPSVMTPQMIVVFHRNGVEDICRLFCGRLELPPAADGEVVVGLSRLPLGTGQYTISVAVTESGYYDTQQAVFFSINPGMYDCWTPAIEIQVLDRGTVGTGTGVVIAAEWSVSPIESLT